MKRVHLDADFLIKAVSTMCPERRQLLELAEEDAEIGMSAVAWYEFVRGPRSPEQVAVASLFVEDDDVVALDVTLATDAAETFRRLGSPRRRANDIAIGTTAAANGAVLWTINEADFGDIPKLQLGP